MYCPKCASQAVPGQRFCRSCGTNLGVILDAIEGKQRGPIDFETLKNDLRELGSNLRAGFEQASATFKNTKRLDQNQPASPLAQPGNFPPPQIVMADLTRDLKKSIKHEVGKGLFKVHVANSRKYSLQRAALSLFGGGAWMLILHRLLDEAYGSGLLASLEQLIQQKGDAPLTGLVPLFRLFWLIGLIPVAKGVAHLVNGIFFAPKPVPDEPEEPVVQAAPGYYYSSTYTAPVSTVPPASYIATNTTNDLSEKAGKVDQSSVTEDTTIRFGVKDSQ
ncbi:MAG: zinc ribbon domain-containing protein [Acidobacteria bacterium]|nr:zinc ribbon domain-containing protein [Acidobacteriota bacterium]